MVLIRLRDAKQSMTRTEQVVAEYVEAHLKTIPSMTIQQLAQNSGTSEATIMRFCRALGYRGYRDFTISVSAALASFEEDEKKYTDIRPGDDLETIVNNVSLNNERSLKDTLLVLDREQVSRAEKLLWESRRMHWYGIGASGLVCQDAQQKFLRINKYCQAFVDGHSIQTAASLLCPEDVAVLVSNSGTTSEIIDALDQIHATGAKSIAITRYTRSPLALGADVVLHISTPEVAFRSGAMGSRIAMLNVVDILFSCVASAHYEEVKEYLDRTLHAVGARRYK